MWSTVLQENDKLSPDVKNIIRLVTSEMNIMPVGTFKYKIFKYPGDNRYFWNIEQCCQYNVAKLNAAQKIQQIVSNIIKSDNIMFLEFKAGYDYRYKIYTGIIDDKIEDYKYGLILRDMNNLYSAILFTDDEYNI